MGFVPYLGPHVGCRGYEFSRFDAPERASLSFHQLAHWDDGSGEPVKLNRVDVKPLIDTGRHPDFAVHARNGEGDFVKFVASPHGHVRNYIERRILGGLTESHYSHNEYPFRVRNLDGHIGDRELGREALGQGFGNMEYTWGLGL